MNNLSENFAKSKFMSSGDKGGASKSIVEVNIIETLLKKENSNEQEARRPWKPDIPDIGG